MKEAPLQIPRGSAATVLGFIYTSDDPAELGQDMIEVRLSHGIRINGGWYPEGDSEGAYRVAVRKDRQLVAQSHWRDGGGAVAEIERLIRVYDQSPAIVGELGSTTSVVGCLSPQAPPAPSSSS